jgi:hypothetical protein
VRLKVTDLSTAKEMVFQTDASDVQKWALTWAPPSVLVLYSSDVGTMSYDIKDGTLVERQATAEEKVLGRSAYEAKYKR